MSKGITKQTVPDWKLSFGQSSNSEFPESRLEITCGGEDGGVWIRAEIPENSGEKQDGYEHHLIACFNRRERFIVAKQFKFLSDAIFLSLESEEPFEQRQEE